VASEVRRHAFRPERPVLDRQGVQATNRPQEAIAQFEALMKENPESDLLQRVHFALGNIYYRAEKWDESIKNYRVVTDNPQPDPTLLPYAMSNLIETYETAGVFDGALTLTRKYLELYRTPRMRLTSG
jgi:tetratricopeptide (TPR) repeat protein